MDWDEGWWGRYSGKHDRQTNKYVSYFQKFSLVMGNINRQPRKYVFDTVVGTTNYQHNRVLWEPAVTLAWCSLVLTMIPVIDWIMTSTPTNVCALLLGISKLYVKDSINMIEIRILRLTRMIQMGSKCKHRQPYQKDTEGDYSQQRRGQYAHRGRLERSQAKECWRHQMVGEARSRFSLKRCRGRGAAGPLISTRTEQTYFILQASGTMK